MPLINCEVNLISTWSPTCVIPSAAGETKFKITETKLYVPVVTLSTQNNYKIIAIDLSKQQALDADPRAIQQINFTANLDRPENTTMFFIIEEAKESALDFSQETVKVL